MSALSFSTFWHGPNMSPMERACLESFANRDHTVNLFSYSPVANLPKGIIMRDAQEVVDKSFVSAYIVKGKSSIADFSDLFRFSLFQHEETFWIDTDIVLLNKPFSWNMGERLICKEDERGICAAILHLPHTDPKLPELIEKFKSKAGPIKFAELSKMVFFDHYGKEDIFSTALSPDVFYPVHYDDFWKVFLPEYKDECVDLCRNAYTLHLWNNLVVECGIWKEYGPPAGSYLHDMFKEAGVLHHFSNFYPEKVMRTLITNYVSRNGEKVGFVRLTGLVANSIRNTIQHRIFHDFSNDILKQQKSKSFLAAK